METSQKLIKACSLLGVNLLEVSKFVQISEVPEIAAWGYDQRTGKNFIFINPKVLRLPLEFVQLILKHEVLHYAGYQEISGAKDNQLVNISLDITINKILSIGQENLMKQLCQRVYPEKSKANILCLARSDLLPTEVPEELKDLWQEVWEKTELPSPASLYFRLVSHTNSKAIGALVLVECEGSNPFAGRSDKDIVLRGIPKGCEKRPGSSDPLGGLAAKVLNSIFKSLPRAFSKRFSSIFSTLLVGREECDLENVRRFIQRLKTRQQLDNATRTIFNALNGRSRLQVYPYRLSRLGLIYLACGVSKAVPLYWNKPPDSGKPKLAVYIDTSPSMDEYKEMEVFLVDELKDYFPTSIFVFAGNIEEVELHSFARGEYESGSSTDFDAPINHFVTSDFDAGLIFTDGYSSVNFEEMKRLRESEKRLFTIYFTEDKRPSSDLDAISEEVLVIRKE